MTRWTEGNLTDFQNRRSFARPTGVTATTASVRPPRAERKPRPAIGEPTELQTHMSGRIETAGGFVATAWELDSALSILERWGR